MDFSGNELFILIGSLRSERRRTANECSITSDSPLKKELEFKIIELDSLIIKFDQTMTKKDQQDGHPS